MHRRVSREVRFEETAGALGKDSVKLQLILELEIHEDCAPHSDFVIDCLLARINAHDCGRKGIKVTKMEPGEETTGPVG